MQSTPTLSRQTLRQLCPTKDNNSTMAFCPFNPLVPRNCSSTQSSSKPRSNTGHSRLAFSKMSLLATSLSSSAGILAVVFLIYYVLSTYLTYRKLAHIKGPWLACISPLWLFYQTLRGRVNVAGEEVLRKYGSLQLGHFCGPTTD
jgi:hypothetical protein